MYIRRLALVAFLSVAFPVLSLCAEPSAISGGAPIHIPLAVVENPTFGTYKIHIDVGIGNLAPLPMVFDTGSTGLHVFADANLEAPGSGVQCTQMPTSVTYGNPARIIFNGVVCYAQLHLGGFTMPTTVPIAYLTSYSCPVTNPDCKNPHLHNPKAMGGYGIFGAGLTGEMPGFGSVQNPIVSLPGRFGSTYSIRLTHERGELVLGSLEPAGAVEFPLTRATSEGVRWTLGNACLFVKGQAIDNCLLISFDTGNGVPWIHTADTTGIPVDKGLVQARTGIGFAPPSSATEAISVVAGTDFADSIKVTDESVALTNVSVQVFFDHVVTYDNVRGVISFAPLIGTGPGG
jgi:hypothetical protein